MNPAWSGPGMVGTAPGFGETLAESRGMRLYDANIPSRASEPAWAYFGWPRPTVRRAWNSLA